MHSDILKIPAGRRFGDIGIYLVNKFGRSAGLMPLMAAEAGREKGASLPTQSISFVIHQAAVARVYST